MMENFSMYKKVALPRSFLDKFKWGNDLVICMDTVVANGRMLSILLDKSKMKSNTVVVFLPGMSGDPYGLRFTQYADSFTKSGIDFARFNSWTTPQELVKKTVDEIVEDTSVVISWLAKRGYQKIGLMGKSFGGGIALTIHDPRIFSIVALAPAFSIGKKSNFSKWFSKSLEKLNKAADISLTSSDVNSKRPIGIIHGTADEVISITNSQKLASVIDNATLFPVQGANHSYTKKDHFERVMTLAIDFFKGHINDSN